MSMPAMPDDTRSFRTPPIGRPDQSAADRAAQSPRSIMSAAARLARVPSDSDVEKMIDSWVASEILYREGKALGVDRGDDMIRDRVAFKMQLLIFDQVRVAEPTEGQLRAWFADNHVRFDEQERVGF